ncbi:hypothetical protein [Nocardioides zhouii]|uniref:Uncharacterized protein n=1 Tax=Nocardioides zhouii TaxID=1168729 RepID=A0A4Q2T6R6_9ACTN|nr:hypothetical protein [Nocardioides zhouii]RYC14566.1 hypothetical protein EUA94_00095 [Nocardioides zhouii]
MSTRLIQAAFINRSAAYLRGHGSRDLLMECNGGRPPLFGSRLRAWYGTPEVVSEALALAESRRWPTEVVDEVHLLRLAGHEVAAVKAAHAAVHGMLL